MGRDPSPLTQGKGGAGSDQESAVSDQRSAGGLRFQVWRGRFSWRRYRCRYRRYCHRRRSRRRGRRRSRASRRWAARQGQYRANRFPGSRLASWCSGDYSGEKGAERGDLPQRARRAQGGKRAGAEPACGRQAPLPNRKADPSLEAQGEGGAGSGQGSAVPAGRDSLRSQPREKSRSLTRRGGFGMTAPRKEKGRPDGSLINHMIAPRGIEPPLPDPESGVLPLDDDGSKK